jgi:hypothetical protein
VERWKRSDKKKRIFLAASVYYGSIGLPEILFLYF